MTSPSLLPLSDFRQKIQELLAPVLLDSEILIDLYFTSLLSGGHLLLVGPPGIAKTRSANAFSRLLGLEFGRIQCTSDLLPSDIIGAEIFHPKRQDFEIRKGPIFREFLLIDELNRAPAKLQSALLEAMEESAVTIGSSTLDLPEDFFVVATMNPYDAHGTYLLPAASLDRFALSLELSPLCESSERRLLQWPQIPLNTLHPELDHARLHLYKKSIEDIYVDEKIIAYIARLISRTRLDKTSLVSGVSSRSSLGLMRASRAYAALMGRAFVIPEDIKFLAPCVLSHRIQLTYDAIARGITPASYVAELLQTTPLE